MRNERAAAANKGIGSARFQTDPRLPMVNEQDDTDTTLSSRRQPATIRDDTDSNHDTQSAFTASEDNFPHRLQQARLPHEVLGFECLNWGPHYSKLVGVFEDLALLPGESRPASRVALAPPPARERVVSPGVSVTQYPRHRPPPHDHYQVMSVQTDHHPGVKPVQTVPHDHYQVVKPTQTVPPIVHTKQSSIASIASSHDRQSSLSSVHSSQSGLVGGRKRLARPPPPIHSRSSSRSSLSSANLSHAMYDPSHPHPPPPPATLASHPGYQANHLPHPTSHPSPHPAPEIAIINGSATGLPPTGRAPTREQYV